MSIQNKLAKRGIIGAVALSAVALIVPWEGKKNEVYLDPANILTSCYGHTGPELKPGMKFTDEQCLDKLAADLSKHNRQMLAFVKVPLSEGEHAAYLSFVYNAGAGRWQKSTMLRLLNEGKRKEACHQLMRWVYIKGQHSNGLMNRRRAETKLCMRDL